VVVRWIVAALHLLALGIGLGAVWVRARALRRPDPDSLRSAFAADAAWGLLGLGVRRTVSLHEKAGGKLSQCGRFLREASSNRERCSGLVKIGHEANLRSCCVPKSNASTLPRYHTA